MEIKITVEAPGLVGAIEKLALALGTAKSFNLPTAKDAVEVKQVAPKKEVAPVKKEEPKVDKVEPAKKEEAPVEVKEELKKESAEDSKKEDPGITLEYVRGKLAEYAGQGKAQQVEVQGAITRFGVRRLTDVDPKDYKELLELVGVN